MSEMIERVARRLMDVEMRLPGAGGLRGSLTLAPAQAREFARAAIEAVRCELTGECGPGECGLCLIDAALKEPGT